MSSVLISIYTISDRFKLTILENISNQSQRCCNKSLYHLSFVSHPPVSQVGLRIESGWIIFGQPWLMVSLIPSSWSRFPQYQAAAPAFPTQLSSVSQHSSLASVGIYSSSSEVIYFSVPLTLLIKLAYHVNASIAILHLCKDVLLKSFEILVRVESSRPVECPLCVLVKP